MYLRVLHHGTSRHTVGERSCCCFCCCCVSLTNCHAVYRQTSPPTHTHAIRTAALYRHLQTRPFSSVSAVDAAAAAARPGPAHVHAISTRTRPLFVAHDMERITNRIAFPSNLRSSHSIFATAALLWPVLRPLERLFDRHGAAPYCIGVSSSSSSSGVMFCLTGEMRQYPTDAFPLLVYLLFRSTFQTDCASAFVLS